VSAPHPRGFVLREPRRRWGSFCPRYQGQRVARALQDERDGRIVVTMMRRFFRWFFESRVTGAITIAQAPNFFLWIVIVAAALIWVWHPPDQIGVALKVIFSGALFVWAGDEILRGVNPWRRCLGVAVLCYGLWTLPR
jgi:hypothetical protein